MKTRKQVLNEMKTALENDLVKQYIILDYKKFQFEADLKYKGNTEAKKELSAAEFAVERTVSMIEWIKKEYKKTK